MKSMDLNDVRIFNKVAELGSFTQAAQQLDVPKSTVSRRVAQLEDDLGTLLLQRSTRKLTLTAAGETFFSRVRRIMDELHDARVSLEEMQAVPRGELRITTPSDMTSTVPRMLGEFQQQYPDVQVIVYATDRKVDLIAEGYDVALRAGWLADSGLVSRRLIKSNLALFASPEYLKEHGEPASPDELPKHACLCFGVERVECTWNLQNEQGASPVRVRGRVCSNDFNVLRGAAADHQGIAILPDFEVAKELRDGGLKRVLPEYHVSGGGLYAVYPSARHPSPRVRAFIDFAAEWIQNYCQRESGRS